MAQKWQGLAEGEKGTGGGDKIKEGRGRGMKSGGIIVARGRGKNGGKLKSLRRMRPGRRRRRRTRRRRRRRTRRMRPVMTFRGLPRN